MTTEGSKLDSSRVRSVEDAVSVLKELAIPVKDAAEARGSKSLTAEPSRLPAGELRIVEARFRTLVEQIPAVTFMASIEGGINELYVSPQIEQLLGFTQKQWREDPVLWYRQLHPEDKERWNTEFAKMIAEGTLHQSDYRFLSREGRVVWVRGAAKIVRNHDGTPMFLQGVAFDITHLKESEQKIRAALREKELLLKEVHHRVKNNLQITSSLLSLQASETTDEKTRATLLESENRIKTMALVHEKLYQSKNLSEIAIGEYLEELAMSLLQSYGAGSERIQLTSNFDNIAVSIDKAIPLGLIINELVSNALKHAFPEEQEGRLWLSFTRSRGEAVLRVANDGIELPKNFDLTSQTRLGLQLVKDLAYQLGGKAEVRRGERTEFAVTFPL